MEKYTIKLNKINSIPLSMTFTIPVLLWGIPINTDLVIKDSEGSVNTTYKVRDSIIPVK